MNGRWVTAAAVFGLALLSFFVFPGHTILQSDTQIYIPILQHMEDRETLTRDIMAVRPHVAFTLYDETALLLRRATGISFEHVLLGQQFAFRAVGIFGLFFLGTGIGLSAAHAWLVTALMSLGAAIVGPAVLLVEFEPVPRGFALPFLLASLGAVAHRRPELAAGAATVALAFHPPTAFAYACILGCVFVHARAWKALALLALGPVALAATASSDNLGLPGRLSPELESILRMRVTYNWVELWAAKWMGLYSVLWGIGLAARWRIRRELPREIRVFAIALPLMGMLSIPVSYLLLERMKFYLTAQFQPGRYLLFVTLFAMLLSAIAAVHAARKRRHLEAALFFLVPLALAAMEWDPANLTLRRMAFVAALSVLSSAIAVFPQFTVVAAVAPFVILPYAAGVQTYPPLHTAELDELAGWARRATPTDALFQFADTGRNLEPGVFRARAARALYVDWKGGGQANFLSDFAETWLQRWNATRKPLPTLEAYGRLGIDYVVFQAKNKRSDVVPIFENRAWVVYAGNGRNP